MCVLCKLVAVNIPDWHNSECLVSMLSGKMGLVWQDDEQRTSSWSSHVVSECHEARGFHWTPGPMLCLDVSPCSSDGGQ